VRIHGGTVKGVFGALCEVFVRKTRQPSVQETYQIYLLLRRNLPSIMRQAGTKGPHGARVFQDLIFAAQAKQALLHTDD